MGTEIGSYSKKSGEEKGDDDANAALAPCLSLTKKALRDQAVF